MKCYKDFLKIKTNNIGFFLGLSLIVIMIGSTMGFVVRDIVLLKTQLNLYLMNPPASENGSIYSNEILSSDTNLLTFDKYHEMHLKVVGNPKEYDNFSYQKAVRYDKRSLIAIFIDIYNNKEETGRICCQDSKFDLMSISINYYLFTLCLNFALNAVFFTDSQISSRYKNNCALSLGMDLLRSLPSNIISAILTVIFKSFVSYSPMIEMLIVEVKTIQLHYFLQKYYNSVIKK